MNYLSRIPKVKTVTLMAWLNNLDLTQEVRDAINTELDRRGH